MKLWYKVKLWAKLAKGVWNFKPKTFWGALMHKSRISFSGTIQQEFWQPQNFDLYPRIKALEMMVSLYDFSLMLSNVKKFWFWKDIFFIFIAPIEWKKEVYGRGAKISLHILFHPLSWLSWQPCGSLTTQGRTGGSRGGWALLICGSIRRFGLVCFSCSWRCPGSFVPSMVRLRAL